MAFEGSAIGKYLGPNNIIRGTGQWFGQKSHVIKAVCMLIAALEGGKNCKKNLWKWGCSLELPSFPFCFLVP